MTLEDDRQWFSGESLDSRCREEGVQNAEEQWRRSSLSTTFGSRSSQRAR